MRWPCRGDTGKLISPCSDGATCSRSFLRFDHEKRHHDKQQECGDQSIFERHRAYPSQKHSWARRCAAPALAGCAHAVSGHVDAVHIGSFLRRGNPDPRMSLNGMVRPCSCPGSKRPLARGIKDEEHAMYQKLDTTIAVIGIDIGKNSFHVVGHDRRGAIVLRQKWSRRQVEARLANMPRCLIGMEACVGAHHLSRKLTSLGHDARLMPAKYVRPYSRGQKNDFRDAEAITEAVQRPTMKFVATKTAEQLDLQALHRVRERLVSQRTGIVNQIRAFLLERGIAVRQGLRLLRAELPGI